MRDGESGSRWVALGVAALGAALAAHAAWTCDDAFISYRYAENLVLGHGLVFNPGERVEGFTNPAWTVWIALGLALGAGAEGWSIAWGIAAYAGGLYLLARRAPDGVPVAALVGALNPAWQIYVTSGLETSAFASCALAGWLALVSALESPRARTWLAGGLLALASLLRPDGVLFVALGGVAVALWSERRGRALAFYALGFGALFAPATLARVAYYGSLLPNTYYAKSAGIAWWDQGLAYLGLYAVEFWALALGFPLAAFAWRRLEPGLARRALLAAAFALVYATYVARVGGDFMYARLLVPTIPFCALLVELGLYAWLPKRPRLRAALALALAAAVLVSPRPVTDTDWRHGVADEWRYYSAASAAESARRGAILRRYFDGLPVRVVFTGGEARLVYASRVAVAIEAETGLTDAVIARQPLARRGRPGHEKHADAAYLLDVRGAHFALGSRARRLLALDDWIPPLGADLDGVRVQILRWDPAIMAALRERGAVVADFPAELERQIAALPAMDDAAVATLYAKLRRFYFAHVDDPAREQAFRARLGR